MNTKDDIQKIIKTKRQLYDSLLNILEKKANEELLQNKKMVGGAVIETSSKITTNVNFLGTLEMSTVKNEDKISFRLATVSLPQTMSLKQGFSYNEAIMKL